MEVYICASLPLQTFQGNEDATEVVLNKIHSPVLTRFVRIRPQTWHNGIALRLELYGCRITGEGPLLALASVLLRPSNSLSQGAVPCHFMAACGGNADTVTMMEASIARDALGGTGLQLLEGGVNALWCWFSVQSLML